MPLWVEFAKLALQAITCLVAGVGLFFTTRQLRLLAATYRDLHDWNRRKAAQDAIEKYKDIQADNLMLDDKFRVMSSNDPVPLATVQNACAAEPSVRLAIHRRLNYFEALSVGCQQGVYDESVVRIALETVFTRTLLQFRPYIEHRRAGGGRNSWSEFETLTQKWDSENLHKPPRRQTGAA